MKICGVKECLAAIAASKKFCPIHLLARTAQELRLLPDATGMGGRSCDACKRKFKEDELVLREPQKRKNPGRTPGVPYAFVHMHCDPKSSRPSRKQIRDSEKPLLESLA